ncbi:predicted protein [Naegleria gruberi]|uniref:Predicted protein n=1 Tax=Naegleria gruberi TaxID=5762 RepID=D2VS20_NAEGR|nr:uncharacterized protein NAEGRDRAFT_71783 [Naegleria gruberi]EFC40269.1 predicted protein [Naegleria gruberi]|eukprot:XP_002673013.1 predicted protein [Naegleria gruberi strain NEG-M]
MKHFFLIAGVLLVVLMINAVSASTENVVVGSAAISKIDAEEQQAMNLIDRLRGNVRGSGANCRFENTDATIKTFICDITFEKKVLVKKVKASATVSIVANLASSRVTVKIQSHGATLYNKDYPIGQVNLDPICVNVIPEVGFCLQLRNLRFNTNPPGCVSIDLTGYFNAFGLHENVLKQPIGWNANKC